MTSGAADGVTFAGPPGIARDLVSLFEEQVARAPRATALVSGDAALAYGELNARANRLARRLRAAGIRGAVPVAVCLDRSFEQIVAVLAVLKLGAAYVPIDATYPLERIRAMLGAARAQATLTARTVNADVLAELPRPWFVDEAANGEDANLGIVVDPAATAHVMFTSGTSGTPKGARLPHSGVSRLLKDANYVALGPDDVVLHHSSFSFDAATFEIWAALLNGGTLVLYPPRAFDVASLAAAVARHGVTTLLLTTSLFHLVAEHEPDCLAPLRQVVVGGDVMRASAVKKVLARHPHLTVVNGYGPTENTVFTCCFAITVDVALGDTVPIGTPISGTSVLVLDHALRAVAPGETGELHAGGLGLAAGYINRPDLTAEKFVPSPFPAAGPVLYKTGDLVRQDADGVYHFVGRADDQVKIRGFRVEPAEIEHVLSLRADVEECVVLARSGGAGEKELVAYVKPSRGAPRPEPRALRAHLASKLPAYMVPSFVHVVDAFALTPNGKLDRRSLLRDAAQREFVPTQPGPAATQPDGGVPGVVLETWRRTLDAPELGEDDSIYDFGASSLSTILVQSELDERLARAAAPGGLERATTPRGWAAAYESHLTSRLEAP